MSTGRSIKAIDDDGDKVFQTHVSAVSLDDSQFVTLKLVKKYPRVFNEGVGKLEGIIYDWT